MRRTRVLWALLLAVLAGWALAASAQSSGVKAVPVTMVVSVETRHQGAVPIVHKEDVRVLQGNNRLMVTGWEPLAGERAALQLFVLMDDSLDSDIGMQFDDIRQFMANQPPTTVIAVGYMRHGTVDTVQNFTKDHAAAAKALRLPLGSVGISPSPYLSVSEVIKNWASFAGRKEILMISNGQDRLDGGPSDPYVTSAIEEAQRSGIHVYGIYASATGHFGHSFWGVSWGQNNMGQLAEDTGGEFYIQGTNTPIAFKPYLDQFRERLNHQYELTFLITPGNKGEYQRISLETEVPNAELVGARMVYVPAAK
jgi:hypothetical protein